MRFYFFCNRIVEMKKQRKRKLNVQALVLLGLLCVCLLLLTVGIVSCNMNHSKNPEVTPTPTTDTYKPDENKINDTEYEGTILKKTDDAGKDYINSTLFLGDSNTARFLTFTDSDKKTFTTKENSIGVVGMGIDAISTMPVIDFSTGRFTMVDAVKILQPQRIIITFGTNNLSGKSTDATNFIERYTKQLKAIEEAYPYADLIVNAIPPVSEKRDYPNVTMTQIDAYNKAIVKMCEENDWKFLNSSEVLKDAKTGYAASGIMEHDGLHLSKKGLTTLFQYFREHSYITEDDRPKPLNAIPTIIGVPSGLFTVNPLTNKDFTQDEATSTSCGENAWGDDSGGCYCNEGFTGDPYAGCVIEENEEPTSSPEATSTPTPTIVPTVAPTATPTPVVTSVPTTAPTVAPTPVATSVPTIEPTATPVPEPVITATPTIVPETGEMPDSTGTEDINQEEDSNANE